MFTLKSRREHYDNALYLSAGYTPEHRPASAMRHLSGYLGWQRALPSQAVEPASRSASSLPKTIKRQRRVIPQWMRSLRESFNCADVGASLDRARI